MSDDTLSVEDLGKAEVARPAPPGYQPRRGRLLLRRLPLRSPRAAASANAALLGLLSALSAHIGYFAIFSKWAFYDDEGYWLIALRSYRLHGGLYHNTYSQCGPFYYEAWSGLYSLIGAPINLDTGRELTLAVWVATSLLYGIAGWLLTRRAVLAAGSQIVAFLVLRALVGEPMEPAGLALLLTGVTLIGVAAVARGRPCMGMALIGASTAAVLLTKVNIGVFVAGALFYSAMVCRPTARWLRLRHLVAAGGLLMIPVLLMEALIRREWVQNLLTIELLSLSSIVVVAFATHRTSSRLSGASLAWCLGSGLLVTVPVAAGLLANGTSFGEFVHGAFLSQRHLARISGRISAGSLGISGQVIWAGVCTGAAAAYAAYRLLSGRVGNPLSSGGAAGARIAVGGWICTCVAGGLTLPNMVTVRPLAATFILAAPLAWVALLRPSRGTPPEAAFPRLLITSLGVLATLQAYPVPGSQVQWAGLLLVPVGVLCISDGLTIIGWQNRSVDTVSARPATGADGWFAPRAGWAVVAGFVAVLLLSNTRAFLLDSRSAYRANLPLGLPGAERLRLPAADVSSLQAVTAALRSRCPTFQSMPGLNSFYFFTGFDPPTDLNTTQWMWLLDDATQRRVVVRLSQIPNVCVLSGPPRLMAFWAHGRLLPRTALVDYIQHNFTSVQRVGSYALLTRTRG